MTENISEALKKICSIKKERVENTEIDQIYKNGTLFFICIRENIEDEYWLRNILDSYETLCTDLDRPYSHEETYNQMIILASGLSFVITCKDCFVSQKISMSEMRERIDTIIRIKEYILFAKLVKSLNINLNLTKEDLDTFYSYYMMCLKKWNEIFPFSLPHFKNLNNSFENKYSRDNAIEDLNFDKNIVHDYFEKETYKILGKNKISVKYKNKELTNLDEIKRELIFASYELKFSALGDYQELNSTIKLLNEWIMIEKEFIDEISSSPLANQSEEVSFEFTNNFDKLDRDYVYKYFKTELLDMGYLSKENLKSYLTMAFEEKTFPIKRFVINGNPNKSDIMMIFHDYYNKATGKKKGKGALYSSLLGEYFEGYTTENTRTNWGKNSEKIQRFKRVQK